PPSPGGRRPRARRRGAHPCGYPRTRLKNEILERRGPSGSPFTLDFRSTPEGRSRWRRVRKKAVGACASPRRALASTSGVKGAENGRESAPVDQEAERSAFRCRRSGAFGDRGPGWALGRATPSALEAVQRLRQRCHQGKGGDQHEALSDHEQRRARLVETEKGEGPRPARFLDAERARRERDDR